MDDRTKRIAVHYGYEAQSRQLIEEMAELTQRINKEWRCVNGYLPDANYGVAVDKIAEETADVEIMIEQVKYLLNIENRVEDWKERKLERTFEKIEPEKMVTVIEGVHSISVKDNCQRLYFWRVDDIQLEPGDVVEVRTKYGIERAWVMRIKEVPKSEAEQYNVVIRKVEIENEQQG